MRFIHLPCIALPIALALTGCGGNGSGDTASGTSAKAASKASINNNVAIFSGVRSNYIIAKTDTGFTVKDNVGTDGITLLTNLINSAQFGDVTINLRMGDKAKSLSQADLNSLIELYIAFFNRVPDADCLAYWIFQLGAGQTLDQMADSFYTAAIQYSPLTGYSSLMSNADFVKVIYKNVLGRSGATAPPDADVQYWANQLATGQATKGSLVRTMLTSAHSFVNDPVWGWVPQLLNNKITVGNYFAIQQGLNYQDSQTSIIKTMAIAAAVTSSDTTDAINLIGITDPVFSLTCGTSCGSAGNAVLAAPADTKLTWNRSTPLTVTLQNLQGQIVPQSHVTCTVQDATQLTIASNCSTALGKRLGTQLVKISGDNVYAQFTLKTIPPRQPVTLAGFSGAGSNSDYNIVVTPTGTLYGWGANPSSVQGPGGIQSALPVLMKDASGANSLTGIVSAAAGNSNVLALNEDGQVYAWGDNTSGKLGQSNSSSGGPTPVRVKGPTGSGTLQHIVQVSAGDANMTALADDGTVYAWGLHAGQGSTDAQLLPKQVKDATGNSILGNVTSISAGNNFTLALTADGKVAAWGYNQDGETGRGTLSATETLPVNVKLNDDGSDLGNIVAISAGYRFALALASDGRVAAWGDNTSGQLAQNNSIGNSSRAVMVKNAVGNGLLANIAMVGAGGTHAIVMDTDGRVSGWGSNGFGELGDGNATVRAQALLPIPVVDTTGGGQLSNVASIAAGYHHSQAIANDGTILLWGSGAAGDLGQGGTVFTNSHVPLVVKDPFGFGILTLAPLSTFGNLLRR
jgi:alpha-tubulin suppressor-like RCC1 family protein